jgi:hypothetical protein
MRIESVYLARDWWTSLGQTSRGRIERLVRTMLPDRAAAPEYSRLSYLDWEYLGGGPSYSEVP